MGGNILRRARPGAAAPPERKTLPAWPYLIFFAVPTPRRWLHVNNRKDHRGGRSSGRRGGFLSIRCNRIIHEIDIKNRPAPRAERRALLASAGRYFIE